MCSSVTSLLAVTQVVISPVIRWHGDRKQKLTSDTTGQFGAPRLSCRFTRAGDTPQIIRDQRKTSVQMLTWENSSSF